MYSYRENTAGMLDAMNQKRAKYLREQRHTEKRQTDNVIDLTGGNTANSSNNPYQEQYIDDNGDDITVTYYNSDGSTRTFRSQVNTQTEVSKQSGIRSQLSQDDSNTAAPVFITASEDKGDVEVEDEYSKYDPEPMADKILEATSTIKHSEVTLTDSSGNTRTFVRRNSDTDYY